MDDAQPMNEAIYVVFETQKDRLNAEDVKKLISFMHSYSEKNKDKNCSDLLNCIIVIKGSATALGRKVSLTFPYVICVF
jgi:hemerythrin-like domain-containing protein